LNNSQEDLICMRK